MNKNFLLIGLILCSFLIPPVMAGATVSFSDLNLIAHSDVQVYDGNGTLIGTWNTTSNGIALMDNMSYLFVIKPSTANYFGDFGTALNGFFSFVVTNFVPIVIILFLIALLFGRRNN